MVIRKHWVPYTVAHPILSVETSSEFTTPENQAVLSQPGDLTVNLALAIGLFPSNDSLRNLVLLQVLVWMQLKQRLSQFCQPEFLCGEKACIRT